MSLDKNFDSTLAAAKCGAEWAWAELYKDLAGPVTGYFAARGASDPEDLTSEVFLQVARGVKSFQGDESSFRSWLFVIAHRRLVDSWRLTGRRPPQVSLDDLLWESVGGNVEEEALDHLVTGELLSAFHRLTDDQRAVIALRIIGNLSLEDTARVLGRRVVAIKALQRRGLKTLKDTLPRVE